jgi:hypothetical protein
MEYKVIKALNGLTHHSVCIVDAITGKTKRIADIPYAGDPLEGRTQEINRGIRISNLVMTGEDMLNTLKEVLPLLEACKNYTPAANKVKRVIDAAECKVLLMNYRCNSIPFIAHPQEEKTNYGEEESESPASSTHTEFMLEDLYRVVGDLQKFNKKLLNALIAPVGQQRSNLEALRKELF